MPVIVNSFSDLTDLLRQEYNWPIPGLLSSELTFEYSASDLELIESLDEKISIRQLRNLSPNQPWAIFILEMDTPKVYVTYLRQVLARLTKKHPGPSGLSWDADRILFICNRNNYQEVQFVHFEPIVRNGRARGALIKRFGWEQDEPARTLLEFNLPALTWPENPDDTEYWIKNWSSAWDVRKVTEQFWDEYKELFIILWKKITPHFEEWSVEDKTPQSRAFDFTQNLINRIMFLYFVQKKQWLNNDPRFLNSLWNEFKNGSHPENSFYEKWLSVLFFEAFNKPKFINKPYLPPWVNLAFHNAPWLNGGLFHKHTIDQLGIPVLDRTIDTIFNFLNRYNFTIRESDPLDVEVAVDPIVIGKVYESLVNLKDLKISEAKQGKFGVFYTERVEIDFMCRRSLVEYLHKNLPHVEKEAIYHFVFAMTDEDKEIASEFMEEDKWPLMRNLLENVKIVDPAVGSGSFLVGMLKILTDLIKWCRHYTDDERTDFEIKKDIIGKCLYGVDVMDWAVHVAELRLWLQLMVETELSLEELTTKPLLPNLDFHLRAGDSLVEEVGGFNLSIRHGMKGIQPSTKRQIKELRDQKRYFFDNSPQCKYLNRPERLIQEESRLFTLIFIDRITEVSNQLKNLRRLVEGEPEQSDMFQPDKPKMVSFFKEQKGQIKSLKTEQEELKKAYNALVREKKIPFVWDIAFVEIFGDDFQGGFDIVVGNPPYVRQEKIADPKLEESRFSPEDWRNEKKKYKAKLNKSVQAHFPQIKKLDGKSDLYIYFYFHGLALLNKGGTFCFITSNSWLDVGFGKDLQKFLIQRVPIHSIYDNEVKRSFSQADINTIIAVFGAPMEKEIVPLSHPELGKNQISRFVMFRKPFEEVLTPEMLWNVECVKSRNSTDDYRVVPRSHTELLTEGWLYPRQTSTEERHKFGFHVKGSKYSGDKWGGKYLRAPDIYYTILEKGKDKLVRLGDIAEVRRGFTTGANEFFYLTPLGPGSKPGLIKVRNGAEWEGELEEEFLKPVIKSPRECKTIRIDPTQLKYKIFMCHKSMEEMRDTQALQYIEWGEKQGFHNNASVTGRRFWYGCANDLYGNVFCTKETNDRLGYFVSDHKIMADCRLYFANTTTSFQNSMNSTFELMYAEIYCRSGLGLGARSTMVYEVNNYLMINPEYLPNDGLILMNRKLKDIYTECGIEKGKLIQEQEPIPLPDRKALDDIVFDAIGLTNEERKEVYWAVCELVQKRLEKARSV